MDFNIFRNKSKITINGKTYEGGKNISITNGHVVIDGVAQDDALTGPITVLVQGNCDSVECGSGDITVSGSVDGDVKTGSGDVACGYVKGSVKTGSGNVQCGNVAQTVSTGSGNIHATGDVCTRR